MIRVENLHKSFNGFQVLRGVSFEVVKGEILALIGQSGFGKSVLLKHVAGLMQPDSGRVVVDGQDMCCLSNKDLVRLRNRFGFLFQGGALFDSMTVFDNVAFPLREKTILGEDIIRRKVLSELEQVGLIGSERKYPAEISGGMIKRTALARALVTDPEIMLFDEPTTGLDPITVKTIVSLIAACHQRLTFTGIVVTHKIPAIFAIVDKVAMLHEGTIVIAGTPQDILASDEPIVRQFVHVHESSQEPGCQT
ncbi:MAG: ABC transporter ATP-binding protein [Deltaproteobacteria bacterium]|nr:MAG: ABC transporter ATP-binding protein [Deltaproteobacteria bacterium]